MKSKKYRKWIETNLTKNGGSFSDRNTRKNEFSSNWTIRSNANRAFKSLVTHENLHENWRSVPTLSTAKQTFALFSPKPLLISASTNPQIYDLHNRTITIGKIHWEAEPSAGWLVDLLFDYSDLGSFYTNEEELRLVFFASKLWKIMSG